MAHNTVDHFIKGDEVYLIGGDGEPFGMVVKIGSKLIAVKPHDKKERDIIIKDPNDLYLGFEWHRYNNSK